MASANKPILLVLMLTAVLFVNAGTHAAALNSYLSNYIPNSTVNAANYFNASLNGANYTIMQISLNDYIIIARKPGSYSLVTNKTTIDAVLTPFIFNNYYPSQAKLSYLNTTMHAYQSYTATNLTDCLTVTGIYDVVQKTTYTCSSKFDNANISACMQNTCDTVPICGGTQKKPASELSSFGVPSPFSYGVQNLSIANGRLTGDYSDYFAILAGINRTNAGTAIGSLITIASNISQIATNVNNNPVFPPPASTTAAECSSGGNPLNQPWYCVAAGYCSPLPFNSTAMGNIQGTLASIQQQLPSTSGVSGISANSSIEAQNYISSYLHTKNGAAFASLLSIYTPKISMLANSTDLLLSRYDNQSLNASISALQNQFSLTERAGVNQSMSIANSTLASMLANTTAVYNRVNASYGQLYSIADNNSAAIISDELSYSSVPTKLAAIANQQQQLNAQLNSGLSENAFAAALPQLQQVRVETSLFIAPLTIGYTIKLLDAPFITGLLSSSNAPVPQKIASAPFYAAMESLIIGILVIFVIFIIVYLKVIRKGKLKNNNRGVMNWTLVFVALAALVMIYTYATYAYGQSATNFLPFNYFVNSVKASNTDFIALNGSSIVSNSSISECVSVLKGYLNASGKAVQVVRLENYSCISGSNISVLGLDCYNKILSNNQPVIFITPGTGDNITYMGLYGTVLYASSGSANGPSCMLGKLFRNNA